MPLYLGDTAPLALYLGDTEITAAYLGDVLVYDASPATVLRPQRAGASDQYLQDGGGQLTDTGADGYWYDGTGGSDAVLVDTLGYDGTAIESGDSVSGMYVWCAVQQRGYGTISGVPATALRDGLTNFSPTNLVSAVPLTGMSALLVEVTSFFPAADGSTTRAMLDSNDGFRLLVGDGSGGEVRGILRVGGAVKARVDLTGLAGTYSGVRIAVLLSHDGSGQITVAVITADGVTTVASGSDTDTTPTPANHVFGRRVEGGGVAGGTIHRVRAWSSPLSIAAAKLVLDGTTTSGWARDFVGVRTGLYLESEAPEEDATTLVYTGGTGGAVTVGVP